MLTETAYAKVNLALHVRRRRTDGYHDIESLFAFVDRGDDLRAGLRSDGALTLRIDGPMAAALGAEPTGPEPNGAGGDQDNLVLRAAQALQKYTARGSHNAGADLFLTKNLPVASGIGGGSADAAAALRLLNRLWSVGLEEQQLCDIAATLGSDIPACVISQTMRVEGRGHALAPLAYSGLCGSPILLVNPGVPLATAPVFQGWDQRDHGPLDSSSLDAIVQHGRNDLAAAAMALVPQIAAVLKWLGCQPGLRMARMSGSGATCLALFDDQAAALCAQAALSEMQPDWWTLCGMIR